MKKQYLNILNFIQIFDNIFSVDKYRALCDNRANVDGEVL